MKRFALILVVVLLAIIGVRAIRHTANPGIAPPVQQTPDTGVVPLEEADLPVTSFHNLHKGDRLAYLLPTGRRVSWIAVVNQFGGGEQTTNSGLFADPKEPSLDDAKDYGVSTSTGEKVSIYGYEIDSYKVELAVDLAASHSLPVIIRISKTGALAELDYAAVRAQFAKDVPPQTGPAPRVPIDTVHHGLLEKFSFPIRLVMFNNQLQFDVSELADASQPKLESELLNVMNFVVDRWDQIERVNEFTLRVLDGDRTASTYVAKKGASGKWSLKLAR